MYGMHLIIILVASNLILKRGAKYAQKISPGNGNSPLLSLFVNFFSPIDFNLYQSD